MITISGRFNETFFLFKRFPTVNNWLHLSLFRVFRLAFD